MFIIFYYDFFSDPLKRHFWILLTNTKRKHKNNNKKIVLFVSQSAPWLKVSFEVNRRKRKEAKDWIHIWTIAFWVCHGAPQPFRSDYLFCPHFPTLHVFFSGRTSNGKGSGPYQLQKFVYNDQFKCKTVIEKLSYNRICAKWWDTKQGNILGLSFKGSSCIEERGKEKRGWKKGKREKGGKRSLFMNWPIN